MPGDQLLLATIEAIHAAGLDENLWPSVLAAVAQIIGGAGATLETIDKTARRHSAFYCHGIPAPAEQAYLEYWATHNPRVTHGMRQKTGAVNWDYQILDETAMDRDGFYSELLPITDFRYYIAGLLKGTARVCSLISVQRTRRQGHVDKAEIASIRHLMPHLQQALDVNARLKGANLAVNAFEQVLDWLDDGAALLRRDGRVVFCNKSFRAIARRHDGVWIDDGALVFASSKPRTYFGRWMAALDRHVGSGGVLSDFTVPCLSGDPAYLLSLRPLIGARSREQNADAIAFIRDPLTRNAAAVRLLRQMFGLTPAEADLAQALQNGILPAAYARDCGLSPNTVFAHLRRLKDKTGWRRTAELTRRLRQLQVPSRPE